MNVGTPDASTLYLIKLDNVSALDCMPVITKLKLESIEVVAFADVSITLPSESK